MSAKNVVDLIAESENLLPDNLTQEVSASDERTIAQSIYESFLNLVDGGLVVQALAGYSTNITPSDNKHFANKKYVDDSIAGIDLSGLFADGGNSFGADATIGTNDPFDLIFETDATPRGAIKDTGEWTIGTTTAFVNAYLSILSTGNDNTTDALRVRNSDAFDLMWLGDEGCLNVKSTTNNTTPVFELFDQFDVSVFKVLANSSIKTLGAFLDGSDLPSFAPGVRNFYFTDGTTIAYNCGSGVFKSTDGTDVANMIFRYLATGGTVDLHWGQHYLEGNWALSNGGGSYGGGTGVFYFKDAAVDATTSPTGGTILQSKNGALFSKHTDGSRVLISGKQATASTDYTLVAGESTFIYTGTGGHTLTMHTAAGYKNSEVTIINNGSGDLTVNSSILGAGNTLKLISNDTDWL